ncbi:MAG: hypothetical protein ACTSYH_00665 [Candidatus Heimdallarchaeaceae archaeon]
MSTIVSICREVLSVIIILMFIMAGSWTYQPPESSVFLKALLYKLKRAGHTELANILKNSEVEFEWGGSYGSRYYSYSTTVYFRLPIPLLEKAEDIICENHIEKELVQLSNFCMPREVGLDIENFELTPDLEADIEASIIEDIDNSIDELPPSLQQTIIPEDFRAMMKEMTPFYSLLYIIENILRLFTLNIIYENYGNDDLSNIRLNTKQEDRIKERKTLERKKKWMRSRGDSDLFYLDFSDFSYIIENNWSLFKAYFPSVKWITQKLDEMSDCRNIIAHTGYLGDNEKAAIRLYFTLIIDQIKDKF